MARALVKAESFFSAGRLEIFHKLELVKGNRAGFGVEEWVLLGYICKGGKALGAIDAYIPWEPERMRYIGQHIEDGVCASYYVEEDGTDNVETIWLLETSSTCVWFGRMFNDYHLMKQSGMLCAVIQHAAEVRNRKADCH